MGLLADLLDPLGSLFGGQADKLDLAGGFQGGEPDLLDLKAISRWRIASSPIRRFSRLLIQRSRTGVTMVPTAVTSWTRPVIGNPAAIGVASIRGVPPRAQAGCSPGSHQQPGLPGPCWTPCKPPSITSPWISNATRLTRGMPSHSDVST
jgi:hypothetical protein